MDKRIKEEEKVQQHTLQTVRDHWKSEKPARQSVTLILKSNSTPTQLYCARTPSHNILPFVSGLVRGACWPTSPPQQPLPKPPTPLHCITKVPPPLTICHPYTSPYPSRVPAWPCPAPPSAPLSDGLTPQLWRLPSASSALLLASCESHSGICWLHNGNAHSASALLLIFQSP